MKVFISWSGERSKQVGEIFSKYLTCIIQDCDPFFSPEIDKGSRWFSEISKELEESEVGIICLTKENISEPWLLFESGALSKSVEHSRVCPFLLDLEKADLTGPLAEFHATKNSKAEIYKLINTINNCLEKPLKKEVLETTFNTFWDQFEEEIKNIPEPKKIGEEDKPLRSNRELIEEVLEIVREDKRERMWMPLTGARRPRLRRVKDRLVIKVEPEMREKINRQLIRNLSLQIMMISVPEDKKDELILKFYEELTFEKLMTISMMEGVKSTTHPDK